MQLEALAIAVLEVFAQVAFILLELFFTCTCMLPLDVNAFLQAAICPVCCVRASSKRAVWVDCDNSLLALPQLASYKLIAEHSSLNSFQQIDSDDFLVAYLIAFT